MHKKPTSDKKQENLSILENKTNRQEHKEIYRRKYNLSPSDFQSEQDIKQEQRRRNESRGSAAYPGIRIQISKERNIVQHLTENPSFNDQFAETNESSGMGETSPERRPDSLEREANNLLYYNFNHNAKIDAPR